MNDLLTILAHAEVVTARAAHPGNINRLAKVMEEVGEVAEALAKREGQKRLRSEIVQAIAMLIRLGEEGDAAYPWSVPKPDVDEQGRIVTDEVTRALVAARRVPKGTPIVMKESMAERLVELGLARIGDVDANFCEIELLDAAITVTHPGGPVWERLSFPDGSVYETGAPRWDGKSFSRLTGPPHCLAAIHAAAVAKKKRELPRARFVADDLRDIEAIRSKCGARDGETAVDAVTRLQEDYRNVVQNRDALVRERDTLQGDLALANDTLAEVIEEQRDALLAKERTARHAADAAKAAITAMRRELSRVVDAQSGHDGPCVGDWVRVVKPGKNPATSAKVGDVLQVRALPTRGWDWALIKWGTGVGAHCYADAVEPWAPRKGDRVRWKHAERWIVGTIITVLLGGGFKTEADEGLECWPKKVEPA